MKVNIFAKIKLKVDFRMKLKPKKDILLFVIIIPILDQGFSFFVYILLMFYTAEFPEFF